MEVHVPFRADQVGSLLRVPELRAAHEKSLQGQVGAEELRELQDRCIREVIRYQESAGRRAGTPRGDRGGSVYAGFLEKRAGANAAPRVARGRTGGGGG